MSHVYDSSKTITVTIDGIKIKVPEGTTVLEAAKKANINIPTLCHHPDLNVRAVCRVCLVEMKGQRRFKTACNTPLEDGNEIITYSQAIRDARKTVVELILSHHPQDCLKCERNTNCELQDLARQYNITETPFQSTFEHLPVESSNPAIVRDMSKCVKCGRCAEACQEVQQVYAINSAHRSNNYTISTAFEKPLSESTCVYCGQCIAVCPVGALYEKDDTSRVWDALENPDLHVVVQTAPAIRVSLGEEFGMPPGTVTTGKMAAALRRLGFNKVFDTSFTADLTIVEEGNELLQRLQGEGTLPLLTSCSPGWINFIEKMYPQLLPHLSTCKSPQQMFGALAKTYYAQKAGISPDKIYVVSVIPCTAKKYECARPEMRSSGYRDVDAALTTRELVKMIKVSGLDFSRLPEEDFDAPFGLSTGAGDLFGVSGGVMEAALRTVYETVTGKDPGVLEFRTVRGLEGIREAEIDLSGRKLKIAVANGLKNARVLLDKIKKGESDHHFIEVMGCPGGCVGGGGQPFRTTAAIKTGRMEGLYEIDRLKTLRKSHTNPAVTQLYEEFLEKPLGPKSHRLLHTTYKEQKT